MVIYKCDSCGKMQESSMNEVHVPCHIAELRCGGYVDQDGNQISGRTVSYDLCNACYNRAMKSVVEEIKRPTEEADMLLEKLRTEDADDADKRAGWPGYY